jgi:hypothetical protein
MPLVRFGVYPHTATYWGSPTPDGSGGETYDAPAALSVRWEERAEQEFDPQGETFTSMARVYTSIDLDVGGYLYLGTSVVVDPGTVVGAFKIRQFRRIPSLRGFYSERNAVL